MFSLGSLVRTRKKHLLVLALAAGILSGCQSKQEKALHQARLQAAETGQAQQVVTVGKNGTTTTTTVQPPAAGQKIEATATTVTPPVPGEPVPAPSGPTVSALPPPPVNITIPAGATLAVRVDQRISVRNSRRGDTFTGEIVKPVLNPIDNNVVVPRGSPVTGVVDVSRRRGRFKGRSLLELRLTSLTLNGTRYPLATRDFAESQKGKGRRSVAMIGGGTGLGMLVGGLARGGAGLAVGGLVGGGAGTAAAAFTGNRNLVIPAESVVRFRLANHLVIQQAQLRNRS